MYVFKESRWYLKKLRTIWSNAIRFHNSSIYITETLSDYYSTKGYEFGSIPQKMSYSIILECS